MDSPGAIDPYATPGAPLGTPAREPSNREPIWIGAAIGMGSSYTVAYAIMFTYMWILTFQGIPSNEMYLYTAQSTPYLLLCDLFAFACFMLGGHWSARLSRAHPMRNALMAGIAISVFGVIGGLLPYDTGVPLWQRALGFFVTIAGFAAGANQYLRRNK